MLAKGNRYHPCKKHGGFYLGSVGGPTASLAHNSNKKLECHEYPELGMEIIWKVEVDDFPVFIFVDDKGYDFYETVNQPNYAFD